MSCFVSKKCFTSEKCQKHAKNLTLEWKNKAAIHLHQPHFRRSEFWALFTQSSRSIWNRQHWNRISISKHPLEQFCLISVDQPNGCYLELPSDNILRFRRQSADGRTTIRWQKHAFSIAIHVILEINAVSNKRPKRPLSLTWEQWTHKIIDFGMEQKITTLHPHASRSLLYIWFVTVDFQSEEALSWRSPPPVTYFGPALDPPLGRSGQNTLMHVRCHKHFIPTKFHKHPPSSSVVRTDFVFRYIYMH